MMIARLVELAKWSLAARLLAVSIVLDAVACVVLWFAAPDTFPVALAVGALVASIALQALAALPVAAAATFERRSRRFTKSRRQWKW